MRWLIVTAGLLVALVAGAARPVAGRNIKVLTNLRPQQVYASMLFVSASLGVGCDHCHDMSDFARDAKPEKETARKMMRMVQAVNRDPAVNGSVTCYTCHHGQHEPSSMPPLPGEPVASPAAAPALDDLVHRAPPTISTMTARGKVTFERLGKASPAVPIEIAWKAPGKLRRSQGSGDDAMTILIDGDKGWRVMGARSAPLGELDLASGMRDARWGPGLDPVGAYAGLKVAGTAALDGAQVVLVDAKPKQVQLGPVTIDAEELAFDATNGRLLRRRMVMRTFLGLLPTATELADFRPVGAVEMPFRVRRVGPGFAETIELDEIVLDKPVGDELFVPR